MSKDELSVMVSREVGAYIGTHFCDGFNLYAPHILVKKVPTKKRNKIVLEVELETNT